MINTRAIGIGKIGYALGRGESLRELMRRAVDRLIDEGGARQEIGGVIAASFSGERRFPSLAVETAKYLALPGNVTAFDLQMACSAYPYAIYLAGRMSEDLGKKVLVIDGDVQSRLVDENDHATGKIFSDAVTASVVGVHEGGESRWDFLSDYDEALECGEGGPIKMDGMSVFTFVATKVAKFLKTFIGNDGGFYFVPHQANAYMVRQLAKTLGCEDRLLILPEEMKNPGSASIPLTMALEPKKSGRMLIAGFGAGYSAGAGMIYREEN